MALGKKTRSGSEDNRNSSEYTHAIWRSTEAEDPNLSNIEIPGTEGATPNRVRWVPKLQHVTGLTNGDTVLCLKHPYIIIGIIVGDIELAEV